MPSAPASIHQLREVRGERLHWREMTTFRQVGGTPCFGNHPLHAGRRRCRQTPRKTQLVAPQDTTHPLVVHRHPQTLGQLRTDASIPVAGMILDHREDLAFHPQIRCLAAPPDPSLTTIPDALRQTQRPKTRIVTGSLHGVLGRNGVPSHIQPPQQPLTGQDSEFWVSGCDLPTRSAGRAHAT